MKKLIVLLLIFAFSACSKQEEKKPWVEKKKAWSCVITVKHDYPKERRYWDTMMTETEYAAFRKADSAYCRRLDPDED